MQMKIVVLFSGHARSHYRECFENIKRTIYDPLLARNCEFDTYFSIWDEVGDQNEPLSKVDITDFRQATEIFGNVIIEVEQSNREHFLQKYYTKDYNQRYSGPCTSGDSASMHYKIWKSWLLFVDNKNRSNATPHLIIRLRPDILFDSVINPDLFFEAAESGKIYIPISHFKYLEVTKGMTDQFAFGDSNVMVYYLTVYPEIILMLRDPRVAKTGEGFLFKQLEGIDLVRFECHFSLRRKNSIDRIV